MDEATPLKLQIIAAPTEYAGPRRYSFRQDELPITIGRASACELCIPDARISRTHLRVECLNNTWQAEDLGSSHGTRVNGVLIAPGIPTVIADGDRIRLGHTRIDVGDRVKKQHNATTFLDDKKSSVQARTIAPETMQGLGQDRLEVLIKATEVLGQTRTMEELHETAAQFLAGAAGTGRALVLREGPDDSVEVLGWHDTHGADEKPPAVSRSILQMASSGQVAELTSEAAAASYGQSIMSLGIRSAICAPIILDDTPEAYLYIDTRESEQSLSDDAATFCRALAQVYRLVMLNLQRKELEQRQRLFQQDLEAARDAQRCLMPDSDLRVPGIEFAYSYSPGRMVAGDLFDIVALDDTRMGMFLGDVMGKGAGAAVAMTAMQTWLRAGLPGCDKPSDFISRASSFCFETFKGARFVTLWFGMVDLEARSLQFVDAGHGFCIHIRSGRTPMVVTTQGGPPLGLLADFEYPSDTLSLGVGDRVVLFSDGVVEQFEPGHTSQFGMKRVLSLLEASSSPQEDVRTLEQAVRAYAESDELTDDLTIASISFP